MYQTLYRKYRPKNFEEVVGQDIIIRTIKNEINNNKINHAYIFSGPRGTGKTSTAKIIAKTINCENPIDSKPCEKCVNCTLYNNKQNIDIIEIDAASNNGVDEIRELRNNVNLVPANGKYKIYIIDEVHMLSMGAFNALLKTLEEPPAHVIFILATTEIHKIPNTILSRCQKFDFNKISEEKIKERLNKIITEEKINIEEEAISEIARLADGGMRDALSILDQVTAYSEEKISVDTIHEINGTLPQIKLKEFISNIINREYNDIFTTIDFYDNHGKNFIKLTEEIINFYRNLLLSLNAPGYLNSNIAYAEIYEDLKEEIEESKIIDIIKTLNEIIPEMKKSNNPKILFEIGIIQIINSNAFEKNIKEEIILKQEPVSEKKEVKLNKNQEPKKIKLNKNLDHDFIKKLEEIRINNALCDFNKKEYLKIKSTIEEIRIKLMDPNYNDIVSLLLEGNIKAYGNKIIIYVYENEHLSTLFNEQIIKIENMLKEIYQENYKVISTTNKNWDKIKTEFNSKKKKYELMDEPKIELMYKNKNNSVDNEFDDIIEYE